MNCAEVAGGRFWAESKSAFILASSTVERGPEEKGRAVELRHDRLEDAPLEPPPDLGDDLVEVACPVHQGEDMLDRRVGRDDFVGDLLRVGEAQEDLLLAVRPLDGHREGAEASEPRALMMGSIGVEGRGRQGRLGGHGAPFGWVALMLGAWLDRSRARPTVWALAKAGRSGGACQAREDGF